jgi:hypothetical protein
MLCYSTQRVAGFGCPRRGSRLSLPPKQPHHHQQFHNYPIPSLSLATFSGKQSSQCRTTQTNRTINGSNSSQPTRTNNNRNSTLHNQQHQVLHPTLQPTEEETTNRANKATLGPTAIPKANTTNRSRVCYGRDRCQSNSRSPALLRSNLQHLPFLPCYKITTLTIFCTNKCTRMPQAISSKCKLSNDSKSPICIAICPALRWEVRRR